MNQSNSLHAIKIDTRLDHRLHRVTLLPDACADEGGEPHEPPLAKPSRVYRDNDPAPRGYFWWLFVLAVDLVAACGLLALAVGPK
jgi:hypothetical protein